MVWRRSWRGWRRKQLGAKRKWKFKVVTDEGVISNERGENLILSTKGNCKKVEMVEDGKGDLVQVDRSYEVVHEDIEWACNGMVARIQNGVNVSIIQQSISDVRFHDFMVAPLGRDKIFCILRARQRWYQFLIKWLIFLVLLCMIIVLGRRIVTQFVKEGNLWVYQKLKNLISLRWSLELWVYQKLKKKTEEICFKGNLLGTIHSNQENGRCLR